MAAKLLTDKYRPETMADIVGQPEAVAKIQRWFDAWKPGGHALLLYGPTGSGKTSSIQALASQRKLDFIEVNASDKRSAKAVRETIGSAVSQQSLMRRGKVFMIDEIDGVSGDSDRGGIPELLKIVEESSHPIVFTANDVWHQKLRPLRQVCDTVEFKKILPADMEKHLRKVAQKEGIEFEPGVLLDLAKLCEGDMRAALNDMQSLKMGRPVRKDDLLKLGIREKEASVYDVLGKIFHAASIADARRAFDSVDKEPDEMMLWIESNIHLEMRSPGEIAAAFDALSHADMFKGRIRKTQDWKLLTYQIELMSGGVAAARKSSSSAPGFVKYQYPTVIATLGRTKALRAEEMLDMKALSEQLHCSVRKVKNEYLPFLSQMM
jgi:replication factor C large subunit